jgi:site-specific DNA recombinase
MKIAAAYIRVSTEDQTEYSPDSQLKIIREYAKKNDMILPDEFIFVDEGISGRKAEKRPAFMRMIGTAKKKPKPFDVILVYALSRFARNREDSVVYKRMLRKDLDVELISTSQDFGNDKTSILIEALLEAMDEYYSIDLGENVKRGMAEKVSRGEPVSIPAFGYEIKNKQYDINPDTAPLVKMIFEDYINGTGYRSIAAKLNTMGIRTKRGGLWENRTVEYVLRNPVYIGKIRWNPDGRTGRNYTDPNLVVIAGSHEHLIDDNTWKKAQDRMVQNKFMYGKFSGQKKAPGFMLQGLVKCSNCGSTLTRIGGTSMQCQAYAHGKCNVSHGITIKKLEEMVLAMIDLNLKFGELNLVQKAAPKYEYESAAIEKQIIRERQKLIRVRDAYDNGVDTLQEYGTNKQRIMDKIEQLESEKPVIKDPCTDELVKKFRNYHRSTMKVLRDENAGLEEKNKLLRAFVSKIVFDKANSQVQVFYYL